uniref:Golgin subfamily A member 1like [Nasonia vitripennis] n=1 Tax=Lepeophtheirus salmonis TaxID=72036 RepID=A0A0K2T7L9_LEPSM
MDPLKSNRNNDENDDTDENNLESKDRKELEEEIHRLKEYINHNYSVFVKRLEKRKEKIQLLNEENSSLKAQAQDLESVKNQLVEYRDNYEQLEGFQNQELAKIKHMLLIAENSLQSEKEEKHTLLQENTKLKESMTFDSNSILEELKVKNDIITNLEAKKSKLEMDLIDLNTSNNDTLIEEKSDLEKQLAVSRKNFEAYKLAQSSNNDNDMIKILESQLYMVENERDGFKSSLLELEIAKHDAIENEKKLIAERKLQDAKLIAEKETLEVKLNHRESEIKKLKEESRGLKENYDSKIKELEESSDSKTYKNMSLEGQIQELKSELNKTLNDLETKSSRSLETANSFKRLETECDNLREELKNKEVLLKDSKATENSLKLELTEQRKKFAQLNTEFENCVSQMDELSRSRESLEMEMKEKSLLLEENDISITKLKRRIKEIDENLPGTIESSDLVKELKSKVKKLEGELENKKSAFKLQDKRMLDMKKTLQKELSRSNSNHHHSNELDLFSLHRSSGSTPSFPVHGGSDAHFLNGSATTRHRKDSSSSSIDIPITDVNIQYLKRAIFKFFTGRDDEAFQMIKVISTILKFSKEESKVLHEIWEWKHSWFASKPKLSHVRS